MGPILQGLKGSSQGLGFVLGQNSPHHCAPSVFRDHKRNGWF